MITYNLCMFDMPQQVTSNEYIYLQLMFYYEINVIMLEQSDQGCHCLPFQLYFLGKLPYGLASLF